MAIMKTIGIIGGTATIESQLVSLFLCADYYVKIAVNNIAIKTNFNHLMDLENNENLHVCELDSRSKLAISNFTKDCDYVLFYNPMDAETTIKT